MPKRDANLTWRDKVQSWWETDTAKAVATIIAVLLIPASVIAWNYATSRANDVRDQLEIGGTSTTNTDALNENIDNNETSNDQTNQQGQANETENSSNNQEQGPANNGTAAPSTNNEGDNQQPAVGGLGSVQALPNTASVEYYTVRKGDNVYRISMKVCGNDSYYKLNVKNDYLKIGQTVKVTCN